MIGSGLQSESTGGSRNGLKIERRGNCGIEMAGVLTTGVKMETGPCAKVVLGAMGMAGMVWQIHLPHVDKFPQPIHAVVLRYGTFMYMICLWMVKNLVICSK